MKYNSSHRITLISFFILFFSILIIFRLYSLQIVDNDIYLDKADKQYSKSTGNVFNRGSIYFKAKDGQLVGAATLKSGFLLTINPVLISDKEDAYEKINAIYPLNKEEFIAKAKKTNDPYEEIAKRLDYDTGKKIEALNIKGVQIYTEKWRFYPGENLASNTIGFLGYIGNEFAGRYGLERYYEDVLVRNKNTNINFFAQIFSNIQQTIENKNEGDIVTTIEPTVESFFQSELENINKKYNSEYTAGMIIDPKTGEIYAMSVAPTFNPNDTKSEKNINIFNNPLVENVYEMGSIIKPLTVASGIDAGVITATSTYYDNGFVFINNKKISNFDGKFRGTTNIQTALSQSLNVGMAYIVTKLGNDRFTKYMFDFGLGDKTLIDLPNEGKNLTQNLNSPRDIEHATASFGQGIALTPVSTVRALSALANGGYLIRPHLVNKINYKIGISKDISYALQNRVIKKETSEEISRMLVKNVDEVLHNGKFKFERHSVAAKTGTAQIAKKGGGGYSEDDYLHSFVGYFPAFDPKFLVFIFTVKPRGVEYSSESLTEPFINTTKFLINYYNIPPDR